MNKYVYMENTKMVRSFKLPEREAEDKLLEQIKLFGDAELFTGFSNAIQSIFLILNNKWQIVFSNKRLLELLELSGNSEIFGLRLGEVLKCVHSCGEPGGCGAAESCSQCGSIVAVIKAFNGEQTTEECRIRTFNNKSLDIRLLATPYEVNNELYTLLSVSDISNEKRRKRLEKIFFHDVLNLAGGISCLSELLLEEPLNDESFEDIRLINRESNRLIKDIEYQKSMISAEFGDLKIFLTKISAKALLEDIVDFYKSSKIAKTKKIIFDKHVIDIDIITDAVLLRRIIGNMLKNALEASSVGEVITVSCIDEIGDILFSVKNISFIEYDVQLKIFQKSFSTKGAGRGLGTYSMKLLGENYLQGKAWFESSKEKGTTFFLKIPRKI